MERATIDGGPRPHSSRRAAGLVPPRAAAPERATRPAPSPASLLLHVALCGLLACAPAQDEPGPSAGPSTASSQGPALPTAHSAPATPTTSATSATPAEAPLRGNTPDREPVAAPAVDAAVPPATPSLPQLSFELPGGAPAPTEETRPIGEPTAPAPARPAPATRPARAVVDVRAQSMEVRRGETLLARFPVSTAARGIGNVEASYRTPLGRHRVCEKFGAGAPLGTVFRSREDTGVIAPILTAPVDVEEDLILTRILWLEGLEPGVNRGPGIDSRERYIYIHGTNEEGLIGTPASHGCVRMRNRDVVTLFDLLPVGAEVEIVRGG